MEKTMELAEFNRLFSSHYGRFVRFANSYIHDLSMAEDFTSEAFAYYWEHRDNAVGITNPRAYILTTIKHKCLNYLHHIQIKEDLNERLKLISEWEVRTSIATLEACEPTQIFTEEAQRIVDETLLKLPEQTRQVFIMSRYHNKSHKEIAEEKGITTKTVEFHITKALKPLRENLKDFLPFFFYFLFR